MQWRGRWGCRLNHWNHRWTVDLAMPGWAARVRTLQRVAVGGGCNGVLRTSATRPSLWVRWRPGRSSSCSPALVVQAMAPFAHRHLAHPQSLGNLQVGLPSPQARMLGPPHQARGSPRERVMDSNSSLPRQTNGIGGRPMPMGLLLPWMDSLYTISPSSRTIH